MKVGFIRKSNRKQKEVMEYPLTTYAKKKDVLCANGSNPDVVITVGGDGTLLERISPLPQSTR